MAAILFGLQCTKQLETHQGQKLVNIVAADGLMPISIGNGDCILIDLKQFCKNVCLWPEQIQNKTCDKKLHNYFGL